MNGCSASASVSVTQNIINPDVSIAPPAQLTCAVTSVTLSASSSVVGVSYNWGGGSYTLYTEISADSPVADFGDAYGFKGTIGFRVGF